METVFQLINSTNGNRSPAMKTSRGELARKALTMENLDKYYVLVVLDDTSGEMDFSQAPLYRLDHFAQEHKDNE